MTRDITSTVFEQFTQRPKAALLMSGSGSNANAILSDAQVRDAYDLSAIVSDNPMSNAIHLGSVHNVPTVLSHKNSFNDYKDRQTYFEELRTDLFARGIQVAIYAGFMKISTHDFCAAVPGVNVHPADLSIKGIDGIAKYRGMHALTNMRQDIGYVRSTFHVVDTPVDAGSAVSISKAVYPDERMSDEEVHGLLKNEEHYIYTRTLRLLAEGALEQDSMPYSHEDIMELTDE